MKENHPYKTRNRMVSCKIMATSAGGGTSSLALPDPWIRLRAIVYLRVWQRQTSGMMAGREAMRFYYKRLVDLASYLPLTDNHTAQPSTGNDVDCPCPAAGLLCTGLSRASRATGLVRGPC